MRVCGERGMCKDRKGFFFFFFFFFSLFGFVSSRVQCALLDPGLVDLREAREGEGAVRFRFAPRNLSDMRTTLGRPPLTGWLIH